jgi:hypothetical protein
LDGTESDSPANEMEMTGTAVARRLNMSKSAVSRAVVWGEKIASDMKLEMFEDLKKVSIPTMKYLMTSESHHSHLRKPLNI